MFFSSKNPDDFIKYGKYEIRIKDKILIENSYIANAKVKWYGGGFAYPFLWKTNKVDNDYQESWSDPRVTKVEKTEKSHAVSQNPKKTRDPNCKSLKVV